jgi:hypothetical protein
MNMQSKSITALTVADIAVQSVWEYTNSDADETSVRPVATVPVTTLTGRVVATEILLANGSRAWALIGNVDATNPRLTEHFLTLSVHKGGQWFALSRYHDFDYDEHGPAALAAFLGLEVDDVFPITFDLRGLVKGDSAALAGSIQKEPRERLTRSEIIALAVP